MSSTPNTTYSSSSFLDNQKSIDTIAGFASGGIAKLVEYPADTVKTRMQSGRFAQKSALQVIWDIVKNEGALKGFYRGVAMPLASCGAEVAVTFAIYNEVVNSLLHDHDDEDSSTSSSRFSLMNTFGHSNLKRNRDEHAFKTVAVASAVAGVANGMLLTPLEVIKCRCQANPAKYSNVRECIKVSAREDGLRVFASGATGTFLREIPGTMAFFLSLETAINVFFPHYRVTQKEVDNNNHSNSHLAPGDLRDDGTTPFYVKPIAGAFAGFGLMLLPFPIDTIKTLTQTSRQYRQLGFFGTGRDIFKKHGVRYFYRGLPITLMRAAPGNAIVFSSYDYFSNYLARKSEERKSVAHQIHFHRQQQQQPTSGDFVVS